MDLNSCKTLGDYIQCAIETYESRGKVLNVAQAYSEGVRLQRMHNTEYMEK